MRWTLYFLSYIIFVAQTNGNFEDPSPIVQLTNESYIKGEVKKNALNESSSYFAFHAIPYAEPPIGTLRFKKPIAYNQSYGNQTNPFDASNAFKQKLCPQLAQDNFIHKDSRDEDCLHLSVYSPKVSLSETDTLFPVVVWIHGGSFEHGSGMYPYHGPERFMKDEDIVMVSINYRLGLLGFMSLGNPELPGNTGLWDQMCALTWVKNNIKAFGGNPDMVTLMGESAGSWSVMFQLLSPQSRDLFHRVIAQSGTPMSPSYHEYPEAKAKK